MEGTQPTLQHGSATFEQQVRAQFSTPLALCKVSAGDETANIRRITLQVIDRIKKDVPGRWIIAVYLSGAAGGDPSATGNTVSIVTGTLWRQVTANAAYELVTDDTGQASIDVEVSGAGSRFVSTAVLQRLRESSEITWA